MIYYENKAVPQTFYEEIDNKYSDTIWCNFFTTDLLERSPDTGF